MPSHPRRKALRYGLSAIVVGLTGCSQSANPPTEPPSETPTSQSAGIGTTTETQIESPAETDTPEQGHVPETLKWTYEPGGLLSAAPTLADQTIFVPSTDLSALIQSGNEQWRANIRHSVKSRIFVDTDVFFVGGKRTQFGFDAVYSMTATGKKRWSFSPDVPALKLFAVTVETVFAGTYTEPEAITGMTFFAIDRATGTKKWAVEMGTPADALVANGVVVVNHSNGITAFSVTDGTKQWELPTGRAIVGFHAETATLVVAAEHLSGVAIEDGRTRWEANVAHGDSGLVFGASVYVGNGQITSIDVRNGGQQWTTSIGNDTQVEHVSHGRVLTRNRRLVSLDAETGRIQWENQNLPYVWGITATDGRAYIRTSADTVHALRLKNGREVWRFEPASSVNVLTEVVSSSAGVYVGANDTSTSSGTLYAFKK